MKKTKAILIAAVVCTMASVCWGQSYNWNKTYGGTGDHYADAIVPTSDGNFIVAGSINYQIIQLVKITSNGDTLWTKTYGNAFYPSITPTSDGNFIIAATTSFTGSDIFNKVYLLKINSEGTILWTKTYMQFGNCGVEAITPTSDGNFIIAGYLTGYDADNSDVFLLKFKPNGDTVWTKIYNRKGDDGAEAITQTSDGNFVIAGYSDSVNSFDSIGMEKGYVYLLNIKPNGDTMWTKTYAGIGKGGANAITPTSDGNFIIAGYTDSLFSDSLGAGREYVFLLKIKPNGDTVWTKTYGGGSGQEVANAITQTSDGNFIVVGFSESFGHGSDAYLLKIKSNGDTLWTKTFGGEKDDEASAVTPCSNGNFVIAGYTVPLAAENFDFWVFTIIDDRYAKKDSLFTFKIPVAGDSLNHGYSPLKVPSGMTVSLGGTISWTPKTDSVYMDHAEFLVIDDIGNKDTLTFNIFVNSKNKPTATKPLSRPIANKNQAFSIMQTSSSQIKFTLPSGASNIDIYDIHGRCVQRLKPTSAQTVWNGLSAAGSPVSSGRYFAKIKEGKTSRMGQFMIVR